jgi:ATP/maltotriose-dependent transcriptional regulator MalT
VSIGAAEAAAGTSSARQIVPTQAASLLDMALRETRLSPGDHVPIGVSLGHGQVAVAARLRVERLRPYLGAIVGRAQGRALALHLRSVFALNRREAEVLALVMRGRSNRAIAATLFLSPATVRKHLEHLYSKLGGKTRTEAANRALAACRASDTSRSRLDDFLGSDLEPHPFVVKSSTSAVDLRELFGLTTRELQVLEVASQGRTNAEIAAQLRLAAGTVKNHLERVYAKLEVSSRTEASARILSLRHRERSVSATAG